MTFTSQKPTVPGAYWYRATPGHKPRVIHLHGIHRAEDYEGGEWSPRLVPVEEVKTAFVEGACAARHWSHLRPDELWDTVRNRARRVVEGKEEV